MNGGDATESAGGHVTPSPLAGYALLDTTSGDELQAFVGQKALAVDFPKIGRGRALHARINAAYLPGMYIGYLRYEVPVDLIALGSRPDFALSVPLHGGFDLAIGQRRIQGGGRLATLASPNHDQCTRLHEGSARYGVSLAQATVVTHLEALLGEPLTAPLEFDPQVYLDTATGRSLRDTLLYAVRELDRGGSAGLDDLFATQLEQLILTRLLTGQPHNYSERLLRPTPCPPPRTVRAAVDYLHAAPHEPLTLADLVHVTGIPGRTINEHFRQATGQSPMAYLRNIRLSRARVELQRGAPETSVTEVAGRWGFAHLGRFSVDYRRTYGESPSDTLRAARASRQ